MQVEFVQSIAGNPDPAHGLFTPFAFRRGQVVELNDKLAVRWLSAGIVKPAEKRETAMLEGGETAMKASVRGRKKLA